MLRLRTDLGNVLFELSRLELNLGLCIAGFDDGVDVEGQSKKYNTKGSGEKFAAVRKQLEMKRSNEGLEANAIAAWQRWLERADQIRDTRNNFIHGRWGTNPETIAEPAQPSQKGTIAYGAGPSLPLQSSLLS